MRFNKLLVGMSACLVSTLPVALTTSCNKKTWSDDQTENDHTTYIKDRTIDLLGVSATSNPSVLGTGWILSHATPSVKDDYKYYIATNMHVIRSCNKAPIKALKYADYSLADSSGYLQSNNFISFNNFDPDVLKPLEQEETSPFYYSEEEQSYSDYLRPAIDLAIFAVDFGTPTGTIKTKLDKLNKLDKINNFVTISDTDTTHNKKKYVGGYPMYYSGETQIGTKWQCHSIAADELSYKPWKTEYQPNQKGHSIGYPDKNQQGVDIVYPEYLKSKAEQFYAYDISPQYMSNQIRTAEYMSAGASGSMLIDEDYNTIGIYWGGWEDANGNFYPSYTLFNTTSHNFIKDFI